MKKIVCIFSFLSFTTLTTMAQDFTMPAPSPKATVVQQFSTSKIELEYSRPSMKGRKIFGEIIPFGKPWRTGANAITKITFEEETIFGDQKVAPGTYALYTIPNKESWIVLLNKNHKSGGLSDIKPENDIAKIEVRPVSIREVYETFTIDFNDITNTSATLNIIWENTKVSVPIKVDNQERILRYLEKELKGKNPPYSNASFYYAEIGRFEEAIKCADKFLEQNPKAFWIMAHKANVYKNMGKQKEAEKTARETLELVRGTEWEHEYSKRLQGI